MGIRVVIAIGLFVLVGCGRPPTPEEAAEFDPYYQRFEAYSAQFGRETRNDTKIRIMFEPLNAGVAGLCEENTFQTPKILVSRAVWQARSEAAREALILHELGHCILGRDHRNDMKKVTRDSDGMERWVPASLMNLQGVLGAVYWANKDYYLNELFQGR